MATPTKKLTDREIAIIYRRTPIGSVSLSSNGVTPVEAAALHQIADYIDRQYEDRGPITDQFEVETSNGLDVHRVRVQLGDAVQ